MMTLLWYALCGTIGIPCVPTRCSQRVKLNVQYQES